MLFLDLTKAFVVVSHSLILSKIERLGLRGKSLSWVSSYVTRQDFACCWKIGIYSYVAWQGFSLTKQRMPPVYKKKKIKITYGSVLGSVFFSFLFIMTYQRVLQLELSMYIFANHTNLVVSTRRIVLFGDWNVCVKSGYLQWLLDNMLNTNYQKLYFKNFS